MKFRILFGAAMMVASSTGLVGTAGIASAHTLISRPMAYTCTGGDTPASGTYASITVTGACAVTPDAVITVLGNVNVASGAVLDAQSCPSTITVEHDVTAAPGSLLGLGCLPNPAGHMTGHPCTVANRHAALHHHRQRERHRLGREHRSAERNHGQGERHADRRRRADGNPWSIKTNTIGGNLVVIGVTPELARRDRQQGRWQRDPAQHQHHRPGRPEPDHLRR